MYTEEYSPVHPLVERAEQAFLAGEVQEAVNLLNVVLAEARKSNDERLIVYLLSNLSLAQGCYGDREGSLASLAEAQRLVKRTGSAALIAKIDLRSIEMGYRVGSLREVCRRARRYLGSAAATADPFNRTLTLYTLGLTLMQLGRFDLADASFQSGLEEAVNDGQPNLAALHHLGIASASIARRWRIGVDRFLNGASVEPPTFDNPAAARRERQSLDQVGHLAPENAILAQYAALEYAKLGFLEGNFVVAEPAFGRFIQWAAQAGDFFQQRRGQFELAACALMSGQRESARIALAWDDWSPCCDRETLLLLDVSRLRSKLAELSGDFRTALREQIRYTRRLKEWADSNSAPVELPKRLGGSDTVPDADTIKDDVTSMAVKYMRAHHAEPLSVSRIAAQVGLGPRMLQKLFAARLHTTPLKFLLTIRLAVAREQLIAAAGGEATIAQIAHAAGFSRMSTFTSEYRSRYGELPSTTLRRASVNSASSTTPVS